MGIDIKHTADGDIDLSSGDFLYESGTDQHKKDILVADKGHYKETPEIGVGIINFLQDENPENMLRTIRKECVRDGMKVEKVAMQPAGIEIIAGYENDKR